MKSQKVGKLEAVSSVAFQFLLDFIENLKICALISQITLVS